LEESENGLLGSDAGIIDLTQLTVPRYPDS
jgi:hypothetical protein